MTTEHTESLALHREDTSNLVVTSPCLLLHFMVVT